MGLMMMKENDFNVSLLITDCQVIGVIEAYPFMFSEFILRFRLNPLSLNNISPSGLAVRRRFDMSNAGTSFNSSKPIG